MDDFTNRLSDYLDDELDPTGRRAVDAHLVDCADCRRVLAELQAVVERARALPPRVPATALWPGIAARVARVSPRRVSFTMPQLAAASVLLALMSAGLTFALMNRRQPASQAQSAAVRPAIVDRGGSDTQEPPPVSAAPVNLADMQYDAAVSDLERALAKGRSRLDPTTIAAVEQSLKTIDDAIAQARQALSEDPANSYLSGHLLETRRRKLDLLRRAAALTMN